MNLEEIRDDLSALQRYEVLLYGSVLTDRFTPRSDIDVAVITRDPGREKNRALWHDLLGQAPDRYDIRVYELLPLPIQIDIADHHEVVFGESVEISWYMYHFRKLWKDQGPRFRANQFKSISEKREALRRAKAAKT